MGLGDVGGDAAYACGVVCECVAIFCDGGGCIRVGCGFRPLCKFFVLRPSSTFPFLSSGSAGSVWVRRCVDSWLEYR